ncbi:uncharacterized protein PGTG_17296 [Puccinia graminis f. sp. tritici CRL 75-36-700-3]|uniref:Uncharacterized protein n=1 Tax=Puccinia graminis f. sp. tritici (strain CRL 75-36-700-3 / race SCCL) TaxID=418459 RepID=E3L399_PUCGT|nr:uncharacterized protein PGTG_17296 [Puccinia graminis f. sp. tritici CRL 75-36-700-3]EFP91024.2 hypothetical protein PGTG_17296 [Puccinia graminis f. sp. tritici CRL 75-36-700-3]
MSQKEFLTLFENWNPAAEYQDYLTGQLCKDYWKKEGIPTTPSQAPETLMRPPEDTQEQQTINSSDQPPAAMNHPQGGYYYPPANPQAQQPYWNQPSYPVTAQGYQYPPPRRQQADQPLSSPIKTEVAIGIPIADATKDTGVSIGFPDLVPAKLLRTRTQGAAEKREDDPINSQSIKR